jgi:hypothetical protein
MKVCIDKFPDKGGYYMDGYLNKNLEFAKQRREKSWDNVFLYCGDEGSGKTTLASQACHFLDNDFGLDNVCFNKKQMIHALDSLPQGSSIQFDEFALEGMAGDLGAVQKIIIKKITTIRKRKLSIIFVVSFPWMLKTYFVMRAQSLIRTFSPDNLQRGFFRFYSRPNLRRMYFYGTQANHKWDFLSNYDFYGKFTNTTGLFYNAEKYEKKKDEAINEIGKAESPSAREIKWKERYLMVARYNREVLDMPVIKIAEISRMERTSIGRLLLEGKKKDNLMKEAYMTQHHGNGVVMGGK